MVHLETRSRSWRSRAVSSGMLEMDSGDSSHAPPEPSSPSLYSTALPAAPTPSAASPIAPLLSAQPLSNSVPGVSGGGLTHPGPLAWTGPVGTASGALNASPHGQHAHPSMAAPPSLVLEAVGRAGGQLRCTPSDSSSPCAARATARRSGGRRELDVDHHAVVTLARRVALRQRRRRLLVIHLGTSSRSQ